MPKKTKSKSVEIFVLMEDDNGGMFSSSPQPTGEAVESKEVADKWAKQSSIRTYKRVTIVEKPSE